MPKQSSQLSFSDEDEPECKPCKPEPRKRKGKPCKRPPTPPQEESCSSSSSSASLPPPKKPCRVKECVDGCRPRPLPSCEGSVSEFLPPASALDALEGPIVAADCGSDSDGEDDVCLGPYLLTPPVSIVAPIVGPFAFVAVPTPIAAPIALPPAVPSSTPPSTQPADTNVFVTTLLSLISAARGGFTTQQPVLSGIAQEWASQEANQNTLTHNPLLGAEVYADFSLATGYGESAVAVGPRAVDAAAAQYVFSLLQASPADNALLLNTSYTNIGIGAAVSSTGVLFVIVDYLSSTLI